MRRVTLAVVSLSAACSSIGPGTVSRDRFDYSAAISDSWKRQILLNVVKMRYSDPPIFVDVGQIVSGYTLEYGANAGGTLTSGANAVTLGGAGKYTDRPTITYVPLTGSAFQRALMTPLLPTAVFSAIQAGWPADGVLLVAVDTFNGLRNERASTVGFEPADRDFLRALEIFARLQRSGAAAIRVRKANDGEATVLAVRSADAPAEVVADAVELRRLLRLDPGAQEFTLAYGQLPANGSEVAVLTRSVMKMMLVMAAHAEVPEGDIAEGRAGPGWSNTDPGVKFRIRCSKEKAKDAFVAVPYRGQWFWVDDRDMASKRYLAFLLYLFTLADTGERGSQPVLTIPT